MIIPNEIVADSILTNWSKQDKDKMSEGFHIFNKIYFHPSHDPENISKLLYNALKKAKPADVEPAPALSALAVDKGEALDHADVETTLLKVSLLVLYQTWPSATDSVGSVVTA